MGQVNIWKCDFCNKTSFHKGNIKKHERDCFYNTETHSCATCLWFSPAHGLWPLACFKNVIKVTGDDKPKLATQCKSWIDLVTIEEYDIWDDPSRYALNLLFNGDEGLLTFLEKSAAELSD